MNKPVTNEICSVCYDKNTIITLPICNHEICNKCVLILHKKSEIKCPMCRKINPLDPKNYNSSNEVRLNNDDIEEEIKYNSENSSVSEDLFDEEEEKSMYAYIKFHFDITDENNYNVDILTNNYPLKIIHNLSNESLPIYVTLFDNEMNIFENKKEIYSNHKKYDI